MAHGHLEDLANNELSAVHQVALTLAATTGDDAQLPASQFPGESAVHECSPNRLLDWPPED